MNLTEKSCQRSTVAPRKPEAEVTGPVPVSRETADFREINVSHETLK
jgi:hypothetical protein